MVDPAFPPSLELLRAYPDWRRSWSHIVAGEFSASSPYSGLLFYAQSEGIGEFYETDGSGGIALLQSHADWRTSWTHIVPLVVGSPIGFGRPGLLLYDQSAGFGAFYATDGHGNLDQLSEDGSWRDTWTHIVAGHLTNSPYSDLLFYDQSNGFGALYTTNGLGVMSLVAEYDDWRESWTHIVVRRFREKGGLSNTGDPVEGRHDVLFYEGSSGHSEVYELDDFGAISQIGTHDLDPGLAVVPGSFGAPFTSLLTYDEGAGSGLVVDFAELAPADTGYAETTKLVFLDGEKFEGWRTTWDIIVPGNFWVVDEGDLHFADGGFTDLLFYERDIGYGEFYLHEPPELTLIRPLAGYCSAGSVRPGETIEFFVSSQVGPYTINVYRQSADEVLMADVPGLPSAPSPLPSSRTAWRDGAKWPPAGSLQIPLDWPSGLYFGRVEAGSAPPTYLPFIVRAAEDGRQAGILAVMNDTTYEAYNHWGGRSLYGFGSHNSLVFTSPGSGDEELPWAFRISFRRPVDSFFTEDQQKWAYCEVPLIRWLARQGIDVEWCTLVDLHRDANLLGHYKMMVNVGHTEYVSKEMRDRIVEFVTQGGNAAFFAGNACWWRVRIDEDGQAMVCYKRDTFDPTDDSSTLTINWPNALAAEMTGVAWSNLVVSFAPDDDVGRARLQYVVEADEHWVFANTGLENSDRFGVYEGGTQTIVGSETDVRQECSPPGFETLAEVKDSDSPVATMGVFTRGGGVFTASTIDWARGLSQDADGWGPIDQMTRNVFDRFNPDWAHRDLSIVSGAPAAAGNPSGYAFEAQSTRHTVFRGEDGHIYELWWDAASGWGVGDLTGVTGAPAAAGDPAGYVFAGQGTQHVVYRGVDGHIYELWWDAASGWGVGDLTGVTGAPAAAGDPAGYAFEGQGTQHVSYRGADGHVYELWWDAANGWGVGDLTAATAAQVAAGDPSGYVFAAQSTQHVVYRGVDGHVYELWWDAANGWGVGDLTAATAAQVAAGDPSGYMFESQGTQHVVYRGADGHIHELWWDATNGWSTGDLTGVSGAATSAGEPAGYVFESRGTQHVVYRGVDDHIHELRWGSA